MRDLLRKDFGGGGTSQSARSLDLWHWTGPWGKTRNRWLLQQRNKALQNCCSMLNDNLLPPHVPKECPCHVNIYLFIALLTDFLMPFQSRKQNLPLNTAHRQIVITRTRKRTREFSKHSFELLAENDGDDEFTCAALTLVAKRHKAGRGNYEESSKGKPNKFPPKQQQQIVWTESKDHREATM